MFVSGLYTFFAVMTGMMIRNRTPFLLPTDGGETTEKNTYIDNTCWWGLPNLCIYSLNNSHLSNSATTQQFKLFPSSLYLWSIVISGGNSRCGVQWGGANRLGMAPLSSVSLSVVVLRLCPYCGTGKACSLAISSGFRNRSSKSNKSSGFSQLWSVN